MSEAPLTIGVVAGEASGDLLGAHLIQALRARLPHARFTGIGGPRMPAAGFEAMFPMEKLAVRGYRRGAATLPRDRQHPPPAGDAFPARAPALFIGVDAPDFNLGLELKLRSAGIPTVHYVGPSIWAWRGGRIAKIRRAVSKMLVLFPFEAASTSSADVPVTYVGHPLAEMLGEVSRPRRRARAAAPACRGEGHRAASRQPDYAR